MKKIFPLILFFFVCAIFFQPLFLKGLFPIPSDTIVGLYNPFRDLYSQNYPRGIPFKNFLITDPVRQEYPWRQLSVSIEKKMQLPLWNPYSGVGTPLFANDQSAALYPLNIIFYFFPFAISWSTLIFLSPILGGIFFYLYVRILSVSRTASFFGAIVFAFCGFNTVWLEWNTVSQTLLWLPLILLSIEKIFSKTNRAMWALVFIFSLVSSFFAGHLQTFFYVFIVGFSYILVKISQVKHKVHSAIMFGLCYLISALILSIQLIPLIQFISLSARDVDLVSWTTPGWFLPWQHLLQFISPDFFGNPTTLNYFGVWNYAELVGYIGIAPLLMVFLGLFAKRKVVWFFVALVIIAFLFALPTPIGILPFALHIPFLSTAQPTRLLSIIDFSLAVIATFGLDYLQNIKSKKTIFSLVMVGCLFGIAWLFLFTNGKHILSIESLSTAKRNTLFPTFLFILSSIVILTYSFTKLPAKVKKGLLIFLILITIVDLFRFFDKFTPFTSEAYLFPNTASLRFLQQHIGFSRIMTTNDQILPPNFSIMYTLQSVDIYDPLYLKRYGEFIAVMERNNPNITPPFGFNRIITPHNYQSPLLNILGVKYVLSFSTLNSQNLKKVFSEGQTQIYENTSVLPKAFFVKNIVFSSNKQDAIQHVFSYKNDLSQTAIIEGKTSQTRYSTGKVEVQEYTPNKIILTTSNVGIGFLVMTDAYYPTWHVFIDGKETKIFMTDYIFRGVQIPKGKHSIVFVDSLF